MFDRNLSKNPKKIKDPSFTNVLYDNSILESE